MQATSTSIASSPNHKSRRHCTANGEGESLACLRGINEQGGIAEFYKGGKLLKLRRVPRPKGKRPPTEQWQRDPNYDGPEEVWTVGKGAKTGVRRSGYIFGPMPRGAIHGFSNQSRMRLLCKMNSIASAELPGHPKFITLTYPRELLPDWKWAKYQLHHFFIWLFRKYGRFSCLWRMEHQEDGSIHYHIVAFVKRFLPWWELAAAWDKMIGNQVNPWESASTEVQALRSWRKTAYYISKYIAKDSEESFLDLENGRHWGARNWAMMPIHVIHFALTESEFYQFRRFVASYRWAKGVKTRSFGEPLPFCHQSEAGITVFMPEKDVWRMITLSRGYGKECLKRKRVRDIDAPP